MTQGYIDMQDKTVNVCGKTHYKMTLPSLVSRRSGWADNSTPVNIYCKNMW